MNRIRTVLIVAAVLLFAVIPSIATFYTDWLWFGEVGYQSVFATRLGTRAALFVAGLLAAFALLATNLVLALRAAKRREFHVMTPEGPRTIAVDPLRLRPVILLIALGVGVIAGLYAQSQAQDWLFLRHATAFGEADPILGHDVGFYVFALPFLQFLQGLSLLLALVALAGTGVVYGLSGALGLDVRRGLFVSDRALRHLSLLAVLVFLLLATGAWLGQPGLLLQSSSVVQGPSYVDVEARLPALRILVVAAVLGALLAAVQAFARSKWPIITAGALYLVVALGGALYASVVQRFVVSPNEQAKETPYIVHNIEATRKAYGLDTVEERQLSGDALLSRADIDRSAATLENIPLWDHQPLLDTFGQIQEIRTYYDFASVHNDRYLIDGQYRQVMLSARELNSNSLPNKSWINERLTFTHGYGIALGPVNQVTPEGLPELFIKNLPPESTVDLKLEQPSIYYGELQNDHVFVKTNTREFHYPKGDDNVFAVYDGAGGVEVGGFLRRALFAIRFQSLRTFLSNEVTAQSRVMFHRRVGERVQKIAPFLTLEEDRYLSIADGRLYWVQDAYTVSDRYPYSTLGAPGVNYIRNSIKAVVDAYHGTTRFYVVDERDPIAQTLRRIFPDLLEPISEMPEGLRTRLRYPQGIFELQAQMFSTYHMTNAAVFYNKEDQWEVPSTDQGAGQALRMRPWYTIMRLPGQQAPEFIQMLPYTPRQKDNLAAWMVARSDAPNYGRLLVFQFPKQKVVFGPRQVIARINQDQVISPQLTLWNQQGSEVIQGTLLTIPIEESLLYIRPLYLRSAGGKIPELKRVIVAYQNQIVMEETLDLAIDRIFPRGGGATKIAGLPGTLAVAAPPGAAPLPATGPGASPRQHSRRPSPVRRCPTTWRNRRASCTSVPSRPSAPATGRSTARRSAGWVRSSTGWRSSGRRSNGDAAAAPAFGGVLKGDDHARTCALDRLLLRDPRRGRGGRRATRHRDAAGHGQDRVGRRRRRHQDSHGGVGLRPRDAVCPGLDHERRDLGEADRPLLEDAPGRRHGPAGAGRLRQGDRGAAPGGARPRHQGRDRSPEARPRRPRRLVDGGNGGGVLRRAVRDERAVGHRAGRRLGGGDLRREQHLDVHEVRGRDADQPGGDEPGLREEHVPRRRRARRTWTAWRRSR